MQRLKLTLLIVFLFSLGYQIQAQLKDLTNRKEVLLNSVYELVLKGPNCIITDNPVKDITLETVWRHESGSSVYKTYGYYNGDGKGGNTGNVFCVRFCPTKTGKWELVTTTSNRKELQGQSEGLTITCLASAYKGFWRVDSLSAGGKWFMRQDGSHPYITGNTMYSFLSGYYEGKPVNTSIREDIRKNAAYFNKLRFGITGDLYPNPTEKPFTDNRGNPTEDGNFSYRPNMKWFIEKVDVAVRESFDADMIADIILNGPDVADSRSILAAGSNNGDNTPFLRYMAARYGCYANVWFCLSNEFDIRKPVYSPEDIIRFGKRLQSFLPYNNPVSVHANQRNWYHELNTNPGWNTHIIVQNKLKTLHAAADFIEKSYWIGGGDKPVIDDELAYEGAGDGWAEDDVSEAHTGAFLGGGYGSTGHKSGNKKGQYFAGNFNPELHAAADNLLWLRQVIDTNISFWRMNPALYSYTSNGSVSIFRNTADTYRALEWPSHEYVLGTNQAKKELSAQLPAGTWKVAMYDIISRQQKILSPAASGRFVFDAPGSRAVLFHFKKNVP